MAVFATLMILKFLKTVEDSGLLGKRRKALTEKTNQFQQPLHVDSRVVKE